MEQPSTIWKEMGKIIQKLSLIAFAIVFSAGCSPKPSADDAQKIFQEEVDSAMGGGFIKLVSFKKTDGQKGQIQNRQGMTVESYRFNYDAKVEAVKLCVLYINSKMFVTCGEKDEAFVIGKDLQPGEIGNEFGGVRNVIKMNPGQRCIISGTIIFEKTEKGWEQNKLLEANFLDTVR